MQNFLIQRNVLLSDVVHAHERKTKALQK